MAYPATTWAKVKADYETGNFTIEKLWKKYGIAAVTIETKIIKEKWIKGSSAPAIQQTIAEKNIAMFAKLGMTQEKLAIKLIEGVTISETTTKELADLVNEGTVDLESILKMVPRLVDDRKLSLEYIKEINKCTGIHAPVKRDEPIANLNINIDAKDIQNNTPAEIAKYYSELLRYSEER